MSSPDSPSPRSVDRRTAIKWVLTAAAATSMLDSISYSARAIPPSAGSVTGGYGPDPDILRTYKPGDLWPLTLDHGQRETASALCDLIIPADAGGPAASMLGVPAFIDEWISAPYPGHDSDRRLILDGLAFINSEGNSRFRQKFAGLSIGQKTQIADDICKASPDPKFKKGTQFFKRFRDLTAGGYYTTPEGMKDIGYIGNRPMATFDGPPLQVIQRVGLV